MPRQPSPARAQGNPRGFTSLSPLHDVHLSSLLLVIPRSPYQPFMLLLCKKMNINISDRCAGESSVLEGERGEKGGGGQGELKNYSGN